MRSRALSILASLTLIAACSSHESPISPALSANTAQIHGTIVGASAGSSTSGMSGAALTVSIVGTNISTTVNGAGQFDLRGVPPGDIQLKFSGSGIDASVGFAGVEGSQTIVMGVSLTPVSATIESFSLITGTQIQVEGRVESLPPTTPAATLIVAGQTIKTDSNTTILRGSVPGTFADLAIGLRVHVKGQVSGPAVLASIIEIQNTNADIPVEINGIVKNFSGPQSGFQFQIDGRLIKGDATTEFFGGSVFADLANDVRAEVKGQQRDGFVFATRIHVNVEDEDPGSQDESASIEGLLTSKSGGIPLLTLVVDGTTVKTSASTEVRRRGDVQDLSVLQLQMTLHVVGTRHSDGTLDARMIQIKDDDVGAQFEISGSMGGVQGTCPTLTFGVNGYSITTDGTTVFTPACAGLKSGTKVTVKGVVQANGTVKASSVEKK